ncbi:hypothetical protein [Burkholderia cenocepacia]|nr:hypothetical protein [Burkholderia cenocepacia]
MTDIGILFIVISRLGMRLSRSEFWELCWAGVFLAGGAADRWRH